MTDLVVLGLDPGEMSGLVIVQVAERKREITSVVHWGEYRERHTAEKLEEWLPAVDIAICEQWSPRGGALSFKPYSLELIGICRYLCWSTATPFILQSQEVKNTWHSEIVAKFPDVGKGATWGGHARDALAHVYGWTQTRTLPRFPEQQ